MSLYRGPRRPRSGRSLIVLFLPPAFPPPAPQLLQHNVIYHLLDDVTSRLSGLTPLVEEEVVAGSATVLATFPINKRGREVGRIAGVKVTEGSISRQAHCFRVLRAGRLLFEGPCSSIKRQKLDVETVGRNTECGVTLKDGEFADLMPGDVVQCIQMHSKRAPLEATSQK